MIITSLQKWIFMCCTDMKWFFFFQFMIGNAGSDLSFTSSNVFLDVILLCSCM